MKTSWAHPCQCPVTELQCPYFDKEEFKINNVSNLSCLDHDPEDERQVDQVKDAEDVLGQPYVCPLAAKRKYVIWSVASLLLDLDRHDSNDNHIIV